MNWFTCSKEDNDWIVHGDQYNKNLKNWWGPIHNGQFRSQTPKENRKTEDTCTNYSGSAKFNGITREGKPEIPIKSYKDQWRENMIMSGMWDVFYLPKPHNKYKKRDILLHQSIFLLEYVKHHVKSLHKGSQADQYVVQNLMWLGVHLRNNLILLRGYWNFFHCQQQELRSMSPP